MRTRAFILWGRSVQWPCIALHLVVVRQVAMRKASYCFYRSLSVSLLYLKRFKDPLAVVLEKEAPKKIRGLLINKYIYIYVFPIGVCVPDVGRRDKATPLHEVNYFTKNPERARRMEGWSNLIKKFQDGLTGMPDEDKMRLPGTRGSNSTLGR